MLENPNIVIVKIDDTLVSFPMAEDGTIFSGEGFESDYEMEDHNIILASFDVMTKESKELYRFSILNKDGQEEKAKVLYENGHLKNFVKHLIETQLGNT